MEHETHIYKHCDSGKNVIAWQVKDILNHRVRTWALPPVFTPYWVEGQLDLVDNVLYVGFGNRIPLEPDNWVVITPAKKLAVVASGTYFQEHYIAWTIETPDLSSAVPESSESVNHPSHYGGKDDDYEAIKVIEAWGLGFHLGNTVKYVARAGKKDPETLIQDLEKAKWYLDRKIANVKAGIDE